MDIIIRNTSDKPIYEQITDQIKNMIVSGLLAEGDPLPSMRLLAKELRISVITTKRAYEELEKEGFIETVTGKGSYISGQNIELVREVQFRIAEEHLQSAVDVARRSGISLNELVDVLQILYKEE